MGLGQLTTKLSDAANANVQSETKARWPRSLQRPVRRIRLSCRPVGIVKKANMWSIGLVKTGNEVGLSEQEIAALEPEGRSARMARAYKRMHQAGAHYVVDSIAEVAPLLDEINARLASGDRP